MYYTGVRDGKRKNGKRRQNLIIDSVTKCFIGEKEKWINKGNNKKQHADSLLHNITSHTQHFYHISKSSAQQFLRNL